METSCGFLLKTMRSKARRNRTKMLNPTHSRTSSTVYRSCQNSGVYRPPGNVNTVMKQKADRADPGPPAKIIPPARSSPEGS